MFGEWTAKQAGLVQMVDNIIGFLPSYEDSHYFGKCVYWSQSVNIGYPQRLLRHCKVLAFDKNKAFAVHKVKVFSFTTDVRGGTWTCSADVFLSSQLHWPLHVTVLPSWLRAMSVISVVSCCYWMFFDLMGALPGVKRGVYGTQCRYQVMSHDNCSVLVDCPKTCQTGFNHYWFGYFLVGS